MTSTLLDSRRWDVAAIRWDQIRSLLDEGWEPFAVVQREPNSDRKSTQATVYLRRERSAE